MIPPGEGKIHSLLALPFSAPFSWGYSKPTNTLLIKMRDARPGMEDVIETDLDYSDNRIAIWEASAYNLTVGKIISLRKRPLRLLRAPEHLLISVRAKGEKKRFEEVAGDHQSRVWLVNSEDVIGYIWAITPIRPKREEYE